MGELGAFLRLERVGFEKRDPEERVHDYRQYFQLPDDQTLRDQGARCMECGVPFCHEGCPLGNRIPDWNDLVYRDRWQDALEQLHATNNFPEFTGYICPAPCEAACVLEINDDPVTIKQVELEIIERGWREGWVRPRPPESRSGRRVAVIGSGPAGLATAAHLNSLGHAVTVYERSEAIGGLMRLGVPDFKLEKWVIDRRVEVLREEGIDFHTGTEIGSDVAGAELGGVHFAMEYLAGRNRLIAGAEGRDAGEPPEDPITATGKRVAVI